MGSNEDISEGLRLEVTLTHEAAAYAAMVALEGMSEQPPHADKGLIWLQVPERDGAVMEAARRLWHAGVGARDVVVHARAATDRAALEPALA